MPEHKKLFILKSHRIVLIFRWLFLLEISWEEAGFPEEVSAEKVIKKFLKIKNLHHVKREIIGGLMNILIVFGVK